MQSDDSRGNSRIVGDRRRGRRMGAVGLYLGGCFHLPSWRGETVVCWDIAQEIEYSGVSKIRIPQSPNRLAVWSPFRFYVWEIPRVGLGHRFGGAPVVGLAASVGWPQIFGFGIGRRRDKWNTAILRVFQCCVIAVLGLSMTSLLSRFKLGLKLCWYSNEDFCSQVAIESSFVRGFSAAQVPRMLNGGV